MMRNLEVSSSKASYQIHTGREKFFNIEPHDVVICDENVKEFALKKYGELGAWIFVTASEDLKTLSGCASVMEEMAKKGVNRTSKVIAIGGGAVQDAATLIASIYMRGLVWLYIPTTLMAMMDSCIGGKSSINLGNFKNILGNFYPPSEVIIETGFVATLSKEDISCGIAEGGKICFASSPEALNSFSAQVSHWRESGSDETLVAAIFDSLAKKKWFIEIDEFDRKERKLLNFGHSFGHALEASTNFSVAHGIGVLIGMEAAICHASAFKNSVGIRQFIKTEVEFSASTTKKLRIFKEVFYSAMTMDKKNSTNTQNLILPGKTGALEIVSFALNKESLNACFSALEKALSDLGFSYEVF